jgi:hypothetical protein
MNKDNTCRLMLKRDVRGCYGRLFESGSIIDYCPWAHEWQGKPESQRVREGIFVFCYGQGEFDVFHPDDVSIVKTSA